MKDIESARAAVKVEQQRIDDIFEYGPHYFGELDEAYEAYHAAAEAFFELYDEAQNASE